MDAFDADVLIYAAVPDHPLGARVRSVLVAPGAENVGSVLLLPELLTKPARDGDEVEHAQLSGLLSRLDLGDIEGPPARVPGELGGKSVCAAGAHFRGPRGAA